MTIHIGKVGSKNFTLPADILSLAMAILGLRGCGKTNTAGVVVEGLLDLSAQAVVIDPTDVWWGLKSSADGKSPGYPIIVAGGSHGDVPLSATDGHVLADFVVRERASVILSLRHLRKGEQRRFVTDFFETLYHLKGDAENRTPLMLVIDECDAFIPQRVGGAEAKMVGAVEDLVRRGRACGLGVCLISQRAASINKDVLTQIELLVAHRHTSPQDRKALDAWIEAHDTGDRRAEFHKSLASLPVGTAWFWSPGWADVFERVDVRPRSTFDSSATPKAGKAPKRPQKLAEVDLDALRGKLAKTIQEAADNDPKQLRAKLAEFEQEARRFYLPGGKFKVLPSREAVVEERKKAAEYIAQFEAKVRELEAQAGGGITEEKLRAEIAWAVKQERDLVLQDLASAAKSISNRTFPDPTSYAAKLGRALRKQHDEAIAQMEAQHQRDLPAKGASLSHPPTPIKSDLIGFDSINPHPIKPAPPKTPGNAKLGGGSGRWRMLLALMTDGGECSIARLSILCQIRKTSSTWRTYLGELRSRGLVDGSKHLRLTEAGWAEVKGHSPLPTGEALVDVWRTRFGNSGQRRIFDVLVNAYPKSVDKQALADEAGISLTSSTWRTYLGELRSLGVVEGSAELRATDEVMK